MTFTEAEPPQSLAALRAGDCDVAVIFANQDVDAGELEEDLSLLVTRHLLDDELRLATPKGHPLAQAGTATLADFASEDWIAGCPRCRAHLIGSPTGPASVRPSPSRSRTTSHSSASVTAGLGVALVPDIILNAAKHDDVATLSLSPASHRQILAVTTPRPAARARRRGCHGRSLRRGRRRPGPVPRRPRGNPRLTRRADHPAYGVVMGDSTAHLLPARARPRGCAPGGGSPVGHGAGGLRLRAQRLPGAGRQR